MRILENLKNYKKGQLSIANIISWFVMAIILAVLTPILQPFMIDAANNALANNQSLQAVIIYMIIPFMWIALIAALMYMATPQSAGYRQF